MQCDTFFSRKYLKMLTRSTNYAIGQIRSHATKTIIKLNSQQRFGPMFV